MPVPPDSSCPATVAYVDPSTESTPSCAPKHPCSRYSLPLLVISSSSVAPAVVNGTAILLLLLLLLLLAISPCVTVKVWVTDVVTVMNCVVVLVFSSSSSSSCVACAAQTEESAMVAANNRQTRSPGATLRVRIAPSSFILSFYGDGPASLMGNDVQAAFCSFDLSCCPPSPASRPGPLKCGDLVCDFEDKDQGLSFVYRDVDCAKGPVS